MGKHDTMNKKQKKASINTIRPIIILDTEIISSTIKINHVDPPYSSK